MQTVGWQNASQLLFIPAHQAAAMIREGNLTAVELITAYVDRLKEVNPMINAIAHKNYGHSLKLAREVDTELVRMDESERKKVLQKCLKHFVDPTRRRQPVRWKRARLGRSQLVRWRRARLGRSQPVRWKRARLGRSQEGKTETESARTVEEDTTGTESARTVEEGTTGTESARTGENISETAYSRTARGRRGRIAECMRHHQGRPRK
ncbi:hypothetical protein niasHS_015758 [Heterodera schachtii]|uniref:Amidase domain-containing protein n=1 Tax=Heterodera schachtii TaxID=97005 RepID=A0ABD2HTX5_HETSC